MSVISKSKKAGTLYLIPTPIGNLGDITLRALETMKSVDLLLTEDTRVTRKLLTHFEIKTRTISYHGFSEKKKLDQILKMLLNNKSIALVSDAGMPGISDPGTILVSACYENDIPVKVLPGASAGITALVASGFEIEGHLFAGFLPKKKSELDKKLDELKIFPGAVVIYVSVHQVQTLLKNLAAVMPDRFVHVAREMTKFFEEHIRGTASDISGILDSKKPKGEYVIILKPLSLDKKGQEGEDETGILEFLDHCLSQGISVKTAANLYAKANGVNRSAVYRVMNSR